jgi:hypothetical protein
MNPPQWGQCSGGSMEQHGLRCLLEPMHGGRPSPARVADRCAVGADVACPLQDDDDLVRSVWMKRRGHWRRAHRDAGAEIRAARWRILEDLKPGRVLVNRSPVISAKGVPGTQYPICLHVGTRPGIA